MPESTDITAMRLKNLLRGLASRKQIGQAVVAVESGDRSFQWIGTEGMTASGGRVAENTPFFIASIDKMYNATVILMLSEAGRLDVDDPIGAYLPPTIARGLHQIRGRDLSEEITVRHLLTHTSGLADWLEDYPKRGPSMIESILEGGDRMLTIEELAAYVGNRLEPHFPPQDLAGGRVRARYSDTNFMLVIAIIEQVTGKPLHEVHREMLYEPLGLRETWFPGPDRVTDSMPLCVRGRPLDIPLVIESVRGICSTAGDMIVFLRALMSGEVFQTRETLTVMQSNWHRFGFPLDRAALRSPGWPIEYGAGLMRFRLPRLFTPASPMPAVLGHTGSTGCWLFWCPELNVFLAGSVNEVTAGAVPFRVAPKILSILRKSSSLWR